MLMDITSINQLYSIYSTAFLHHRLNYEYTIKERWSPYLSYLFNISPSSRLCSAGQYCRQDHTQQDTDSGGFVKFGADTAGHTIPSLPHFGHISPLGGKSAHHQQISLSKSLKPRPSVTFSLSRSSGKPDWWARKYPSMAVSSSLYCLQAVQQQRVGSVSQT